MFLVAKNDDISMPVVANADGSRRARRVRCRRVQCRCVASVVRWGNMKGAHTLRLAFDYCRGAGSAVYTMLRVHHFHAIWGYK